MKSFRKKNEIEGLAVAIYGSNPVLSVAKLKATSRDKITVISSEKSELNVFNGKQVREVLEGLLLQVLISYGEKVLSIAKQEIKVRTQVIYGVPEVRDEATYKSLFVRAFPEYFNGKIMMSLENEDANSYFKHLIHNYFTKHATSSTQEIESHPYYFFLDEGGEERCWNNSARGEVAKMQFVNSYNAAIGGDQSAKDFLQRFAYGDGQRSARDHVMRTGKLPRFLQMGYRHPEFQNDPRYTYLSDLSIKDDFVRGLLSVFSEKHHICVKTPLDKPSAPFVDICATHLADIWKVIDEMVKGEKKDFIHVMAK